MQKCIGVIIGGKSSDKYGPLCKTRTAYMLPYGGRYRLIDFTLSNMANNDFSNVLLYAGQNVRSTLDHVGNGKPWELNRRRNGLVIFPTKVTNVYGSNCEIDIFYDTLQFYNDAKEEYLYFVDPMIIDKEDLTDPYERFIKEDLDVMLFYINQKDSLGKYIGESKLIFDEDGNLINIGENLGIQEEFPMMTRVGFMKKDVFVRLVKISKEDKSATNLTDAISKNISDLKIGTYKEEGYTEIIRGLKSYYESNMKLLDMDNYDQLFYKNGVVLTKSKDEPSTLYNEGSKVSNSLIANGCIIDGQVENSIIFRGVKIEKGAIIKNSILFQKTTVEKDAIVINSIIDKLARIKTGVSIVGSQTVPYVIEKNLIVEK